MKFLLNILKRIAICDKRFYSVANNYQRPLILGIETSCDDTGAAIVDNSGLVIGESIHSQQNVHLKYGGIIPPIAQDLHRKYVKHVVDEAIEKSGIKITDLDAIAVTNRPGLPLSLQIGVRYAKHLCRIHKKPLIPIHHMEAHALAVRLEHKINYPFLTLLCSGGHCLLAIAKEYDKFYLLGETLDDAPGEAFDKIARRLKLRNIPEYQWLSGGAAIEKSASKSINSENYEFPLPLSRHRDCQFSFAGLKNTARRFIEKDELDLNLGPDDVIPNHSDFSLGFLKGITRHIAHRTQRAIEYCEKENVFAGKEKFLVFSGGCACNDFIFKSISEMTEKFNFKVIRPSKNYCTDNGVMIAWNGVERFNNNSDVITDIDTIGIDGKSAFGINIINTVKEANLSCKWVQISNLRNKTL